MNKRFLTSLLVLLMSLLVLEGTAQTKKPTYNKKSNNYSNGSDFYINTGVGISNNGIPFYLGLDYNPVHPDISLGASFGFHNTKERHNDHYHEYRSWNISFNGNYHFNKILNIPNNFDVYAGLNIGYYNFKDKNNHDDPIDDWSHYNSGVGVGLQAGARWFITDKIGLNLQFGGGTKFSSGNFGVTFRL